MGMSFIRARNDEQKNIRLEQIRSAAQDLFDTEPYEKITLASIAKKLDFSRVNLYNYVSTKEEIYLLLTTDEMSGFFQDILDTFEGIPAITSEEFSLLWAETLFRHERLLKLCSILFSIIEKNVTVQSLAEFKKQLFIDIERVYPMLKRLLPGIPEQSILTFLDYQLHHIAGLYPAVTLNEIQREAIRISGIPYEAKDFVSAFSEFLIIVLSGLEHS